MKEQKESAESGFSRVSVFLDQEIYKKLEEISVIHLFNMSETVHEAVLLLLEYQSYREKIFDELCDPEGLSILSAKGKKIDPIKKRFFERTFSDHAGI